jgi:hypothetical protein
MPDRSNEFRKLATDCVAIARDVTDPVARATLLTMAQTWYDMANGAAINPDSLVRKFNDHKISDRPAVQQLGDFPHQRDARGHSRSHQGDGRGKRGQGVDRKIRYHRP